MWRDSKFNKDSLPIDRRLSINSFLCLSNISLQFRLCFSDSIVSDRFIVALCSDHCSSDKWRRQRMRSPVAVSAALSHRREVGLQRSTRELSDAIRRRMVDTSGTRERRARWRQAITISICCSEEFD